MTSGSPPRIACLGEVMIELALEAERPRHALLSVAGDTYNTAVYLKRSAPELDVSYVTRLGRDAMSDRILSELDSEGIDTSSVEFDPDRQPGLYAIATDEMGERSFTYWRENSAARNLFQTESGELEFDALASFDMIHLSAITLAILPEKVRALFTAWLSGFRGKVSFDSNHRPRLWGAVAEARSAVEWLWLRADIGLPSLDDEMALFGDDSEDGVLNRLVSYGVLDGALKRGPLGPRPILGPEPPTFAPAPEVVDTTAAGDSFNGAYLAARLTGRGGEEALADAHALAVKVIGHRGAILPREGAEGLDRRTPHGGTAAD